MLYITGISSFHPKEIIDNSFIEAMDTGTNAEWIVEKIGVHNRVTTLSKDYILKTKNSSPELALQNSTFSPLTLAFNASKDAFKSTSLKIEDIGLILCASCNTQHSIPSLGTLLAQELGASSSKATDIMSACPAFALHLNFLSKFNEQALPDNILCVTSEAVTQSVDYSDRTDPAIWGDGAAVWIVSKNPKKIGLSLKILETSFEADATRCDAVILERFGHFKQDGRAVRDFSVRQTVRILKRLEEQFDIDWGRDIFVGHQANKTMLEQICRNREISDDNHWHNVSQYGNQGASGAPAVIAQNWDKLKPGMRIIVAVVGAGLSWGSAVLECV
jgi:3-oxoacyl-[acyl-carrier-protein] synthase III